MSVVWRIKWEAPRAPAAAEPSPSRAGFARMLSRMVGRMRRRERERSEWIDLGGEG